MLSIIFRQYPAPNCDKVFVFFLNSFKKEAYKELETHMKIALYQPDIPQNLGAMIRLCACTGVSLDIIEPCGFLWHERKIRQSAMDYFDQARITKHAGWDQFIDTYQGHRRVILMTTKASEPFYDFEFQDSDILLAGQESAGAPDYVHDYADGRICIPMYGEARSLNIVNATSMILGEAIRQTQWRST